VWFDAVFRVYAGWRSETLKPALLYSEPAEAGMSTAIEVTRATKRAREIEKTHLLEAAGFNYNYERMMYIHRAHKKAFSLEFIEAHPAEYLADKIHETTDATRWQFYFNSPLPDGIRRELERVLG